MNNNSLVDTLREQIEKKHREALHALGVIAEYVQSSDEPTAVTQQPAPMPTLNIEEKELTSADRVRRAIANEYKPVDEIVGDTGLPEASVRAALYSKSLRVEKKKIKKKMCFKLLKPKETKTESHEGPIGDRNAAALVREFLAKHPRGCRSSAIHEALGEELKRLGINKAAIGAALYNMKKHGNLSYDPATGIYTASKATSVAG